MGFGKIPKINIKFMKITENAENSQNVTDRSDVSESALFDIKYVNFNTFCTFPLGLDKGLDTFLRPVHSWRPVVYRWCQNCLFREKPLGLDRVFSQFC